GRGGVRGGGAYRIRGVYGDLKYHAVGEAFYQMQYDGSLIKRWRTPPLWGVGHTAPYGHDGASLDLHAVIRRHGGEALKSRQAYAALTDGGRRQGIACPGSPVLYQTGPLAWAPDRGGK